MKGLWMAAAGLLALLGLCLLGSVYVQKSGAELADCAQQLQQALLDEDWPRAEILSERFGADWEREEKRLACLIDHSLLRDVEEAQERVSCRMQLGQSEEAAAAAWALRGALEVMMQAERTELDNIL